MDGVNDKANWKDDAFLRTHLADTASVPKAVKEKRFEKTVTFVVKPKHGQVYRKTCPAWTAETVRTMLEKDESVERFFEEG